MEKLVLGQLMENCMLMLQGGSGAPALSGALTGHISVPNTSSEG